MGVKAAVVAVVLTVLLAPARATAGETAHASATARGLVVAGTRFFPVMLLDQCSMDGVARGRALGVNLIVNGSCPGLSAPTQLGLLARAVLGVLPIASRSAQGADLVGWTYPDEPDNNGWTPASLAAAHPYPRGNADGLVTFLTTSGRFFQKAPYAAPQVPLSLFAGFARLPDMAGFDLYPLNACQTDLSAIYDAQRAFVRLAGSTPTFQWIETGPIRPTYCGGFAMTPAELSAEVWLAVAGGARGIGYFTHTFSPGDNPLDVSPAVQGAMRQTNAMLAAVRPGLLGITRASSADSTVVKVLARSGGGRLYVIAVNTITSPTKAQIHVPALRDGPATVVGEGRTVVANEHSLIDHFGGLQVHVYVQAQ
jgi:hypothetical protein